MAIVMDVAVGHFMQNDMQKSYPQGVPLMTILNPTIMLNF